MYLPSMEQVRKRKLRLHVFDKQGEKLQGAKIIIEQKKPHFPIGCAVAATILSNTDYQNWFTSRGFAATTFDNEMKWYFTEQSQGHENYTIPDAMVAFFKQHGVSVRGHCIYWADEKYNLPWVKALPPRELLNAAIRRIERLGQNASAMFYKIAATLDRKATMFLNEYNTSECPEDMDVIPSKYIQRLEQIRSFPGNENMVIALGLQGHFDSNPNIPYVRACLDILGETKMPIWFTEFDIGRGPNRAEYLEEVMREAYSHPAVQGIILWPGNAPRGCKRVCLVEFQGDPPQNCSKMCLTDSNFKNLPTGDVVDKLLKEWNRERLEGNTDDDGVYAHQVFYGHHLVTISDPRTGHSVTTQFEVAQISIYGADLRTIALIIGQYKLWMTGDVTGCGIEASSYDHSASIKVRKRKLRVHVTDKEGNKLQRARITVEQKIAQFPIGCAVAATILNHTNYQNWFTSRAFAATTFDNEMKWYYTERNQGQENYTIPDAMLAFFRQHGVCVRGHCVHWAHEKFNPDWAKALSPSELWDASLKRVGSVMSRYAGQVIAWDVMNENMHYQFFEERLGRKNASAMFYNVAKALDPKATLFLNEYNTLENPNDMDVIPSRYIQKLEEIRSYSGNEEMVIALGLQAHFDSYPNLPYVRACLDILGETKMPIWLTEFDIGRGPNQESFDEPGDPARNCSKMCLTDSNFKNLPNGDVVDRLMKEWNGEKLKGSTDENGVYEHQVFYGQHLLTILNPRTGQKLTRQLECLDDSEGKGSFFNGNKWRFAYCFWCYSPYYLQGLELRLHLTTTLPVLRSEPFHFLYEQTETWVQISEGKETVVVALRGSSKPRMVIGSVIAHSGCWSMVKGGITVNVSKTFELYFEVRKRKLRLHVLDKQGEKLQGAKVIIEQKKPHFPIGCAVAATIVNHTDYQNWFTSRGFAATTFDNEMKWYFTERNQGHENYTIPDAMVAFFKQHGVSVRGHCIYWADEKYNLAWVKALPPRELLNAAIRRIGSVMSRYAGEVIAWDVVNENVHFHFFEDKLGQNASAKFYKIAATLDQQATMFLNEYNTVESPEDMEVIPSKYIQRLEQIRSFPGNEDMVIALGLQGHFNSNPNLPYVRACLDILGETKMPIWFTEFDIGRGPNQAEYLQEVMREAYSHPAVQGIILWPGNVPRGCKSECLVEFQGDPPQNCSKMCLTDSNFKNLPTGDVVDKLLKEWNRERLDGNTDDNGVYEHQVFYGHHLVTISDPRTGHSMTTQFEVTTDEKSKALDVWISL
ncbi:hypothetical protein RJ640_018460 [Escallonia rubra]|uniref:GH10 domain-containing protein n=1 Tax=Escallonia rubra TaxID=112253 RepID=A0AA88R2S1_9ASTE|nr:hypothetical protein RJ640_018460 [Escallonia rubra]